MSVWFLERAREALINGKVVALMMFFFFIIIYFWFGADGDITPRLAFSLKSQSQIAHARPISLWRSSREPVQTFLGNALRNAS